jgi:hypothetical protein
MSCRLVRPAGIIASVKRGVAASLLCVWIAVGCRGERAVPRRDDAVPPPTASSSTSKPASAPTSVPTPDSPSRAAEASLALSAPPRFAGSPLDDAESLRHLADAEPLSFKPVGSTSTVFRTKLRAPLDAAYKVASRDRPLGPVSEVAAYRVGRCLGLNGVPPAVSRQLPLSRIDGRLEPESEEKWPEIEPRLLRTPQGIVSGAAIYWIKELRELDFGGQPARATALAWLRDGGELPEARRALARSMSDMLAFDFLIANGDRWSGGNVKGDAAGTLVWVRDHDLAFASHPSGRQRELWKLVTQVERFSRPFVARVRALDRACIERELREDPKGARGELLTERQIGELLDRRLALLSHLDALIAERGEARVLFFE